MIGDAGNSGGGVAVSVVPLLQERFRQLQRMKELREEKQLLRMLSTSSSSCCSTPPTTIAAAHNYELLLLSENYFSGHQLRMFLNPPKPCCQLSLSLWPGEDFRRPRTPLPSKSWFSDQNSDIDTSLHL